MLSNHLHYFNITTEKDNCHNHIIKGYAGGMIGVGMMHFHSYSGISSYSDHTHDVSGITGLPIKTENGHIHKIDGVSKVKNNHKHKYSGYTEEDIAYTGENGVQAPNISVDYISTLTKEIP